VKQAPDAPGINCSSCKAPADEYKLTKIEPTVKP
jgi:ribose transport system substrate-binding protein